MVEPLNIEWSENASKNLDAFYQYLLDEWSFREAEKFLDQVQEFEFTISYFPKSFVQSKKRKRYRIGLVHRYVSAIYEVRKSDIVIIALIDNRSNKKVR
jgi:plasmid stabilization system protein ParE